MTPAIANHNCAAVILAGGEGRRLNALGKPKPLIPYRGRPLIEHQLNKLVNIRPLFISTELSALADYGQPLLSDGQAERLGPLAGIASALAAAHSRGCCWLLVCPVDTPEQPLELLPRLLEQADAQTPLLYAQCGERPQPLHSLWSTALLAPLQDYLNAGERRAMDFLQQQAAVAVEFEDETAFANINTPEDLGQI
ncbi:MAG: NTP transferase domain-containing protein [Cellvibrionaceae bacterium]|nr:NTP transferase domain-containing protein [Cellvibrionaceae bacterium]